MPICQMINYKTKKKKNPEEQNTLAYDPDVSQDEYYSTAIDVTADSMTIQMGKLVIEPFTTDKAQYQMKHYMFTEISRGISTILR